jgi:hypothetical protein
VACASRSAWRRKSVSGIGGGINDVENGEMAKIIAQRNQSRRRRNQWRKSAASALAESVKLALK